MSAVENSFLRAIFLMLRPSLKDSDLPGRTTVTTRIETRMQEQWKLLKDELKVGHNLVAIAICSALSDVFRAGLLHDRPMDGTESNSLCCYYRPLDSACEAIYL